MDNPSIQILPTASNDRDRAADYRARLAPVLEQAATILNEAAREGIEVSFQMPRDQYGRWTIPTINVVRVL
jgi:hypothetical protein